MKTLATLAENERRDLLLVIGPEKRVEALFVDF